MTGAQEALDREKCRRNAHYFIFASGLQTKDEHDLVHPAKTFPDEPELRCVLDDLLVSGGFLAPEEAHYALAAGHSLPWLQAARESGILLIEKSRQVVCTWTLCAFALWRAKFHANQLVLIQSKREDDAASLVYVKEPWFARISFMESTLPKHLRTLVFPRAGSYGQLFFPTGSRIWGIPEGGDIIRSNTASLIFSDEMAFQPEAGAAFTAAIPSIKGGGQFVGISSANPGEFQQLVEAEAA